MTDETFSRVYEVIKFTGKNAQQNRDVNIPYGEMEIKAEEHVAGIPTFAEQRDANLKGVSFDHMELKYINEIGARIPHEKNPSFADLVIAWPAVKVPADDAQGIFADTAAQYNCVYLNSKTGELDYCRIGRKFNAVGGGSTFYPMFFPVDEQRRHFSWAFDLATQKHILESKNRRSVSFRIPYLFPTGTLVTANIPWIPAELYKEIMEDETKNAEAQAALERKRLQQKIARDKKKAAAAAAAATADAEVPPQPSSPAPVVPAAAPAEVPTTPAKKPAAKKAAKRPAEEVIVKKEPVDDDGDEEIAEVTPAKQPAAKKPRKIAPKKVPTSEEVIETLNRTDLTITPAAEAAFSNVEAPKLVVPKLLLQPADPIPTGEQLLQHFITKCESGFKWPNPFVNKKTVEELFLDKESGPEIRGCFVTMQHFGLVDAMASLVQKSNKVAEKPTIKVPEKDLF